MSHAIYTGVVKHNPLEGGFWELHTDGGACYQLRGIEPRALQSGARFEVHGRADEEGMGIGMNGGAFLDVVRVQKL
jgi:copper(I)-binding protein